MRYLSGIDVSLRSLPTCVFSAALPGSAIRDAVGGPVLRIQVLLNSGTERRV